jgi:hypothetical protein
VPDSPIQDNIGEHRLVQPLAVDRRLAAAPIFASRIVTNAAGVRRMENLIAARYLH